MMWGCGDVGMRGKRMRGRMSVRQRDREHLHKDKDKEMTVVG